MEDTENIFSNFILSLVSGIILLIIGGLGKLFFNIYKSYKLQAETIYEYEWVPDKPYKNSFEVPIKVIHEYKRDIKFDFEKGDFVIDNGSMVMVEGFECFKMHIVKFINTEKDKYKAYEGTSYGVSYNFKNAKEKNEFAIIAQSNSSDIIEYNKDWIKEIYYIKKYKNIDVINIGMGLKGIDEIVNIDVKLLQNNELHI